MNDKRVAIYHCLKCGAVVHAQVQRDPPQCCGSSMVLAAEESSHPHDEEFRKAAAGEPVHRPDSGRRARRLEASSAVR